MDELTEEYPIRLTTGTTARLLQHRGAERPVFLARAGSAPGIDLSPEDVETWESPRATGCRVVSRRGSLEAPVRFDGSLRPGLAFMAVHFPDETDVNILTLDAWDPKSGTAEFKATAVRVEALV